MIDLLFLGSFGFKILIAISQTLFFFSSQKGSRLILMMKCYECGEPIRNKSKELWTACGCLKGVKPLCLFIRNVGRKDKFLKQEDITQKHLSNHLFFSQQH